MIKRLFEFLLLTLLVTTAGTLSAAQDTFETLKIGSHTYTNVTVLNKTRTALFISHAGGLISFKVNDLSAEDLKKLGYAPPEETNPSALAAKLEALTANMRLATTNNFTRDLSGRYQKMLKSSGVSLSTLLIVVLVTTLLFHLFYSICMRMICQKTNTEPGVLVWLPLLQFIPLHRAAGISPWLILLYFIPPIGLFVFVYWCIKVCRAREKSAWLVILVFIPLLNLLFIPYLAFSSADGRNEAPPLSVELG